MRNEMTTERFAHLLKAYGAAPARWPEAERAAMQAFIAARPEAAETLIAEAAALDDLLGPAETAPSDLLEARLLAALPRAEKPAEGAVRREQPLAEPHSPGMTRLAFLNPALRAPVAAAAALVIGIGLGFVSGALTAPSSLEAETEIYAEAFSAFEEDWIDWLEEEA